MHCRLHTAIISDNVEQNCDTWTLLYSADCFNKLTRSFAHISLTRCFTLTVASHSISLELMVNYSDEHVRHVTVVL